MKKLYILLSYVACLSSTFAAVLSPSSDFDDCDEKIKSGYVEPHTTPQAGPNAVEEADSMMQLFLSEPDQAGADGSVAPQNTPQAGPVVGEEANSLMQFLLPETPRLADDPQGASKVEEANLKIYYTERDGDETSLKRFTKEKLTTDYAFLNPGDTIEVIFIPEIDLHDSTTISADLPVRKASIFDTIGWLANVRAWSKWWLNPWAWWKPSRYSLDSKSDTVEWESVTSPPMIRVTTQKDVTYLVSQVRLFLLQGWSSKFAPYIAPATRVTLERAVTLRFEIVEKPTIEAIGFKGVTLCTRINSVTHRLERIIRATK